MICYPAILADGLCFFNPDSFTGDTFIPLVPLKGYIDLAQSDACPANLVYDDVFAFFISVDIRFVHEGMRMPTDDDIDGFTVLGKLYIAHFCIIIFIPEMRKTNDEITLLIMFQDVRLCRGMRYRVKISCWSVQCLWH